MRSAPALLAIVLLVAGCASPTDAPVAEGPIDLPQQVGTLLLDLQENVTQTLTTKPGVAWMSPSGSLVSWTEDAFAIVLDRAAGAREVAPSVTWTRIEDDGSGIELVPGEARVRVLLTGDAVSNRSLPPTPDGGAWTGASADYGVLVAERVRPDVDAPCQHEISILTERAERTVGCHAKVASDGRVGWTEGNGVRARDVNGTLRWIAQASRTESPAVPEYIAYENPMFTANGTLFLRLRGERALNVTELVDENMTVLATLDGPYRLALLDVSRDGRWLLARVFAP